MSDWDEYSVIELANTEREQFNDGDWIETPYITSSGTRILQTGNVGIGKLLNTGTKRYISDRSFRLLKCKEVFIGDILICRLADPAGRACLVQDIGEKRMITSVDVTIYRPDSQKVDRRFLVSMLSTDAWFREVSERCGGSTRTRIARSELGRIRLRIPGLEEQKRIADALSSADALIATLERLITKKQAIKQGMMQELLTGQTRLPGFAGRWKYTRLGDGGSCIRGVGYDPGSDLSPNDRAYTVRLLRSNNVQSSRLDYSDLQFVHERRVSPSQILRANDIVMCMANGSRALVGKAALLSHPPAKIRYTIGAFMGVFRCDSAAIVPVFAIEIIGSDDFRRWLDLILSGSSINNLRPGDVESFVTPMPALEEQVAIAEVLGDANREIDLLHQRLEKAHAIKQGMMQELLTGRTRLPVLEHVA